MSELVPLLRDGANDLEALLLESAEDDAYPDPEARARTLAAVKVASRATAVVGVGILGWRWISTLGSGAMRWIFLGGVGVAVTVGAARLAGRPAPSRTAPSAPPASSAPVVRAAPREAASVVAPVAPSRGEVPVPASPAQRSANLAPPPSAPQAAPAAIRPETPPPSAGSTPSGSLPAPHEAAPALPAPASPPAPASAPPSASPPASSLRREAALLESVREWLATSQADRALTTLDQYEAEFPSGALSEEASVLRVEALVAAGRRSEAARIEELFERRYPASSYVSRVRALVGKNL